MEGMDVKSLKGIAVVSIEHGEKIGTVDSMAFDLESRRVVAIKVRTSSMPRSGRSLISMNDIQSIGPDAVMIQNKECIRAEKSDRESHGRPDLNALDGLRVVTEDGTFVGNLATVQFNQKNGDLTAIETSGGGFMDLLRRNQVIDIIDVISIGADVVVVPDSYAPKGSVAADGQESDSSETNSDEDESVKDRTFNMPAGSDDSRH